VLNCLLNVRFTDGAQFTVQLFKTGRALLLTGHKRMRFFQLDKTSLSPTIARPSFNILADGLCFSRHKRKIKIKKTIKLNFIGFYLRKGAIVSVSTTRDNDCWLAITDG